MIDWLAQHGPTFSLILFFSLFVLLVGWVCWPANRPRFEKDSQIPFKDE